MITNPWSDLPLCPVDGCPQPHFEDVWRAVNTPGPITVPAPAHGAPGRDAVTAAITAAAVARGRAIENILRAHLETHDVLDFVRTIHRLRCESEQHHGGIRPHLTQAGAADHVHAEVVLDDRALQTLQARFATAFAPTPPG